jgi:Cupredoxin-like domain
MKIILFVSLSLATAMSFALAQEKKAGTTLGEKTKDVGRAIADTTKKAADSVVDAITPDSDARKVEVKLTEHQIDMPKRLEAGKTAFVVRNSGKEKHNFEIQGEGIEKKFLADLGPDETKVLHVNLKPGNYKVHSPAKNREGEGLSLNLTVK